ncbi:MAG: DM13 domain-containing protein, partial [Actinomycetota bacterium]
AIAFVIMLWLRVPPIVRVLVLVVPFAIVNWWLLSPYFIDDVVDEDFSTSIAEQAPLMDDPPAAPAEPPAEPEADPSADADPPAADAAEVDDSTAAEPDEEATDDQPAAAEPPPETVPPEPTGPVLLGLGQFVGLAGHEGTGDAGLFRNPDGSLILRFENFDIENGPDLEVYWVPGADQTSLPDGSIHLGALKGNIGDQNYELPAGTELAPGPYTALVWCEAFSVEFVGATITI